ncbi:NAD-binding protein [bacterium]|nr:NAD-binding protein [bacterium]
MERENFARNLTEHIIICNCNEKVKNIIEEIHSSGDIVVVLIVQKKELWENNSGWHPIKYNKNSFFIIFGSPFNSDVLQSVAIESAKAAIILSDPLEGEHADAISTLVALNIEYKNPRVHTVMELLHSINREHLNRMNVDEVVCLGDISEKLIAQSCISPGIKNIFKNLMSASKDTPQIFVPEITDNLLGLSYKELAKSIIEKKYPYIIIGFIYFRMVNSSKIGKFLSIDPKIIVMNPIKEQKNYQFKKGDKLILIAHKKPDLNLL